MAGTCFATFRSRGPQPPAAEARCRSALEPGCKYPIPRRLRPWAKKRTVNCPRSGQPGATPGAGLQPAVLPSLAPGFNLQIKSTVNFHSGRTPESGCIEQRESCGPPVGRRPARPLARKPNSIILLTCCFHLEPARARPQVAAVNFASLVVLLAARPFVRARWLSPAASVRQGWVAVPGCLRLPRASSPKPVNGLRSRYAARFLLAPRSYEQVRWRSAAASVRADRYADD